MNINKIFIQECIFPKIDKTVICFYLRYTSVEPKHLWASFDSVLFEDDYKVGLLGNKITVEQFMSPWTDQAGYPLINVRTTNDNKWFIISQVKYL